METCRHLRKNRQKTAVSFDESMEMQSLTKGLPFVPQIDVLSDDRDCNSAGHESSSQNEEDLKCGRHF